MDLIMSSNNKNNIKLEESMNYAKSESEDGKLESFKYKYQHESEEDKNDSFAIIASHNEKDDQLTKSFVDGLSHR